MTNDHVAASAIIPEVQNILAAIERIPAKLLEFGPWKDARDAATRLEAFLLYVRGTSAAMNREEERGQGQLFLRLR